MARARKSALARLLGPGLVAGASDDDPSGIATYSQAGAQFGFAMLWSVVLAWPLMVAIQLVAAHIGRVTGSGIMVNVRTVFPRSVTIALAGLVMAANTINIAADLAAMGEALQMVAGGGTHGHALLFGIVSVALTVLFPYRRVASILRWLTLSLLAYVATAFTIHIPWTSAASETVFPTVHWTPGYLLVLLAVFGTTISPYVFFWQASQEVEDMHHPRPHRPLKTLRHGGETELQRMRLDTAFGMAVSNIVAFFIILITAAILHPVGITNIQTSAQAAEALRPLAGDRAYVLFALGIIGTGLLAVPVLAITGALALSEVLGIEASLDDRFTKARTFYGFVAGSTLIAVAIDFTPLDPIRMLFWSAVINGIVAVPVMIAMMLLVRNETVMGRFKAGRLLTAGGWCATMAMISVVAALGYSLIAPP